MPNKRIKHGGAKTPRFISTPDAIRVLDDTSPICDLGDTAKDTQRLESGRWV